jgi:hypothetical protein
MELGFDTPRNRVDRDGSGTHRGLELGCHGSHVLCSMLACNRSLSSLIFWRPGLNSRPSCIRKGSGRSGGRYGPAGGFECNGLVTPVTTCVLCLGEFSASGVAGSRAGSSCGAAQPESAARSVRDPGWDIPSNRSTLGHALQFPFPSM